MNNNSIKVNFAYQLLYRIFTIITPLITSPYLSRVLGAENLGIFSATNAHANYFVLLAMLGVEYYGNRTIAICNSEEELERKFWGIYYVQLMASIIAIGLYLISLILLPEERIVYAICQGVWILAAGINIHWYFFGTQQFKSTTIRTVTIKIINIILMFFLVKSQEDLIPYILVMTISLLINQVAMWQLLLREIHFNYPDWKEIQTHIKPMVEMFIPVIALSVFHVMDKTMVDMFSDEMNGGCYYNVDKLINFPIGVIAATSTVMLPKISKEYHNNIIELNSVLQKSSEVTIAMACAISFGLGAISYEFVPFFFGNGYDLCKSLILGFVPVIILKSLEEFMRAQYLIPTNNEKIYIRAVIIAALVNLIANYFLIKKSGAKGAVIGTMMAEFIVLVLQMHGVRREMNFMMMFFKNSYYILAGGLMFLGVRIYANSASSTNWLIVSTSILLGMFIYGTLTFIYAILNNKSVFHTYIEMIVSKVRR